MTTSMAATKAWNTRNANSRAQKLTATAKKAWETRRKNQANRLVTSGLETKTSRRELHVLINKLSHKQALQVLHAMISPKSVVRK